MPAVVGVKLRFVPKVLWFAPGDSDPAEGDSVVVETERGRELGTVVEEPHDVAEADLPAPLKPVVRRATHDDLELAAELAEKERKALPIYRELVQSQGLDMKPVDVEYLFGGDKVVFYFSAEERVDFRELVRELASRFKTRIDMRQIGVRDEARLVGGVGHCGQQLCCTRFAGEFQPVSIRMAKEQDLPLNPLKISGLCGRLMCCLRYEYDAYKDFKTRAPKRGAPVDTPLGAGKVSELNTPKETVSVRLEDGTSYTVPLAAMGCSKGTGCPCSISKEALEATGSIPGALTLDESAPEQSEQAPRRRGERRRRSAKGPAKSTGTVEAGQSVEPTSGAQVQRPPSGRRRRRRRSSGGDAKAES